MKTSAANGGVLVSDNGNHRAVHGRVHLLDAFVGRHLLDGIYKDILDTQGGSEEEDVDEVLINPSCSFQGLVDRTLQKMRATSNMKDLYVVGSTVRGVPCSIRRQSAAFPVGAKELGSGENMVKSVFKIGFDAAASSYNPYTGEVVVMDEAHHLTRPHRLYQEQLGNLRGDLSQASNMVLSAGHSKNFPVFSCAFHKSSPIPPTPSPAPIPATTLRTKIEETQLLRKS